MKEKLQAIGYDWDGAQKNGLNICILSSTSALSPDILQFTGHNPARGSQTKRGFWALQISLAVRKP
ncbi:hypothetical protein B1R32_11194 [Abditibacterium utsteinense]|uniref:Uncharacterized protein n=1 Tax=Abditibacterium utsteinense TaxID=1960156 RepID=A0A2S8SRV1_9BACT|nr:hypothetical protein B1R32_11194 [Abditibacterium utsteinense]